MMPFGRRNDARGATPVRRSVIPKDGAIYAVVGSAGMGKTVLVGRFAAREVTKRYRRLIAFDPTGDVFSRCTAPMEGAGIPLEWTAKASSAGEARVAFARGKRAVFLSREGKESLEDLGAAWLDLADEPEARGMVLVADEAHLLFPLGIPAKSLALAVSTLVRNRQQSLLWTTQRPQNVSVSTRQNSKHVAVFRADSARFVDPGCGEFGYVERFQAAHALSRFEYLYRSEPGDTEVTVTHRHAVTGALPF